MAEVNRWRCESCQTIFPDTEALIGPHPFAEGSITGCPRCKAAHDSGAALICDEPGCDEESSCGWPSPVGYRRTCHRHFRSEVKHGE